MVEDFINAPLIVQIFAGLGIIWVAACILVGGSILITKIQDAIYSYKTMKMRVDALWAFFKHESKSFIKSYYTKEKQDSTK